MKAFNAVIIGQRTLDQRTRGVSDDVNLRRFAHGSKTVDGMMTGDLAFRRRRVNRRGPAGVK
ncbi:hypothetical protein [Bradyrhizobium sp.]|uniref:hypothetical protein n=1 Tax=Bradyrhizobium sp. TaxID=376 RepID=UPI0039E3144D